jgi:hypothetical protein
VQLIGILLIAVSVLTALSGFSVLVGATKGERLRAFFFFVATISAFAWALSIAVFLQLPSTDMAVAELAVFGIYIAAIVMDVALMGFIGWKWRLGKILTVLLLITGIGLIGMLIYNPALLYDEIVLTAAGNEVSIVGGWYYLLYVAWFMTATAAFLAFCYYQARKASSRGVRIGYYYFLVGLMLTGGLSLVFDLIFPFLLRYDLIWIGPLAISATIIGFYYAILRYRIMPLRVRWLKVLSYIVIMSSAAIVYMLMFFVIFTALFKIPNPSASVIALNFIMIIIVLLLLPVINELNAFVKSLISVGQVDIAYIVKKLNKIAAANVDMEELAAFLADHLHFSYVGFVINGRLHGSGPLRISADELRAIDKLKADDKSIWQDLNGAPEKEALEKLNIKAVAELRNARGKAFGQIIVGKAEGKLSFERRDLIQLEMIINLVAAVIDSEKYLKKG